MEDKNRQVLINDLEELKNKIIKDDYSMSICPYIENALIYNAICEETFKQLEEIILKEGRRIKKDFEISQPYEVLFLGDKDHVDKVLNLRVNIINLLLHHLEKK